MGFGEYLIKTESSTFTATRHSGISVLLRNVSITTHVAQGVEGDHLRGDRVGRY